MPANGARHPQLHSKAPSVATQVGRGWKRAETDTVPFARDPGTGFFTVSEGPRRGDPHEQSRRNFIKTKGRDLPEALTVIRVDVPIHRAENHKLKRRARGNTGKYVIIAGGFNASHQLLDN